MPVAVETFHALKQRQRGETTESGGDLPGRARGHRRSRVNLLNWDGNGVPAGLFPESDSVKR